MARVTAIYRPDDYPGTPDAQTREDLAALFAHVFPGSADPQIDKAHSGLAVAAHNPQLALSLAKLSAFMAGEMPWSFRKDLRELAIQTVNLHFNSDFSFQSRLPHAAAAGISEQMLADLPEPDGSSLFDTEQQLVMAYARAVASGAVPEALSARAIAQFGEKGVVEFTALVAFWSFWAMFLNATGPDF